jgi:riboflavin synthase
MFTGIITDLGTVRAVAPAAKGTDTRFEIATAYDTAPIAMGASICCSGACLTVVAKDPGRFAVEASAETLACTTLGAWRVGTPINLEQALKVGDELGGHIVSGHVDAVAVVAGRREEGGSVRFEIEVPEAYARYIASKGSVALDGVSLTVNEVSGRRFGVNIIPHTQRHTTFETLRPGDHVNMEVDVLARYVARQLGKE